MKNSSPKPKVIVLELASGTPLPELSVLKKILSDFSLTCTISHESVVSFLESFVELFALIINAADNDLFESVRKKFPRAQIILVTRESMETYSAVLNGREEILVDHVIAHNDSKWTAKQLSATMNKLRSGDIFGVSEYLNSILDVKKLSIFKSSGREEINKEVAEFVERNAMPRNIIRLALGISEEFQMNALFDAANAGAPETYGKLSRKSERILEQDHAAELQCAYDGNYLAVSIKDPFGAMTREKFFEYIKKVLRRDEGIGIIDTKEMGAGLGLFKVFYSCHALILNLQPRKATEMIAIIDLKLPLRDFSKMARSLHYFST